MSQTSVQDVTYAYVAKDIARQLTTVKDPTSATYIKEGEIAVVGIDNALLTTDTTLTDVDKVQIAELKGDDKLFKSPVIDAGNVTFYKVKAYSAPTDKVVYIGYNGTSGDLEADVLVPATEYMIKIRKLRINDHYEDSYLSH